MKMRYALILSALLPLMVACKANDGSADVTAAPAAAPTEAVTSTEVPAAPAQPAAAAAATDAPAATDTTTPAPAVSSGGPIVPPQGPAPVQGTDFELIEGGQPFAAASGRIEVVEIFAYTCPACFRFQAILSPWKARLPADVNFIYMPAAFGGPGDEFARAVYAAQSMGVFEQTHEPIYAAIQVQGKLRGGSREEIAALYGDLGVDATKMASTMASFGVNAQMSRAKLFAQRSKVTGTPSVVVAGKYLVKGKSFEDMLRISEHLIASERAAQGR